MNTQNNVRDYLELIKNKRKTYFVILFVILALVSAFTFLRPLRYGAVSRLLVVQNFSVGADPYALSRSNEFLSGLLADVITTDSFYDEVMNSGYNIDRSYFNKEGNYNKELEKWEKTVDAKALNNRGVIEVEVLHPDRYQLGQIAQAVNFVMQNKNANYHGGGNAVEVKIMNKPVISDYPVNPNIVLNYSLALAMSFLFFLLYIYIFPEAEYDLWPNKELREGFVTEEENWNESVLADEPIQETDYSYQENDDSVKDDGSISEEPAPMEVFAQPVYAEVTESDEASIQPEEIEAQEDEFFSRETDEDNYEAKGNISNLIG